MLRKRKQKRTFVWSIIILVSLVSGCALNEAPPGDENDGVFWAIGYPGSIGVSETSFNLKLKSTSDAKAYYVVLEDGSQPPNAQQIAKGLDADGSDEIPAAGGVQLSSGTEQVALVSGLDSGNLYSVFITAQISDESSYQEVTEISVPSGAIAPLKSKIPLEQDFDGLHFYWTAATSIADGYVIQRSTDSSFKTYKEITLSGGDTTAYTDKEYAPDAFNYYRVASYRDINGTRVVSTFTDAVKRYGVETEFESDVNIILLPDTQFYCRYSNLNKIFYTQNRWLAENWNTQSLMFAGGLGDIVDNGSGDLSMEWSVGTTAYDILKDAKVPYGAARGNHDDVSGYKANFSPSRWYENGLPLEYYGGHSNNGLNSYFITEHDGQEFLFLFVDYYYWNADLTWIQSVLDAHPKIPTVLITHIFLDITTYSDQPSEVSLESGQEWVFNSIAKSNPQIFLIASGHNHGSGMMTATNDAGLSVMFMLCDYQMAYRQGNGWIRILRFNLSEGVMQALTYSPYVADLSMSERTAGEDEAFLTHSSFYADHQFKYSFDLKRLIEYLNP